MSVPSFAGLGPQIKVGVVFTSDTFNIPDNLSDTVTNLFNDALSRYSNINIVNQKTIRSATRSLGFNQNHWSNPQALVSIGEKARVKFMVWTKVNYDVMKAARAEASRALGKILKLPKESLTKHVRPDINVKVIDVASQKFIFNDKLNLDIFSKKMKEQLLQGLLNGGSLDVNSIDTAVIQSLAEKFAPIVQTVLNEASQLAEYKDAGNTEEIINNIADLAQGKFHFTKKKAIEDIATTYKTGDNETNNASTYDSQTNTQSSEGIFSAFTYKDEL